MTPSVPEGIDGIYLYRVWRQVNDGPEELLNNAELPLTIEGFDDISVIASSKDRDVPVKFLDYNVVDNWLNADETLKVKYIARMYTYIDPGVASGTQDAPRRAPSLKEDEWDRYKYYVNERELEVEINGGDVITALTAVSSVANAVKRTYYNVMGQASSRPWQGVNIVVTTYDNGDTTTGKVMY